MGDRDDFNDLVEQIKAYSPIISHLKHNGYLDSEGWKSLPQHKVLIDLLNKKSEDKIEDRRLEKGQSPRPHTEITKQKEEPPKPSINYVGQPVPLLYSPDNANNLVNYLIDNQFSIDLKSSVNEITADPPVLLYNAGAIATERIELWIQLPDALKKFKNIIIIGTYVGTQPLGFTEASGYPLVTFFTSTLGELYPDSRTLLNSESRKKLQELILKHQKQAGELSRRTNSTIPKEAIDPKHSSVSARPAITVGIFSLEKGLEKLIPDLKSRLNEFYIQDITEAQVRNFVGTLLVLVEPNSKPVPSALVQFKAPAKFKRVLLSGSWNGWSEGLPMNCSSNGNYYKHLYFPAGIYEYKFQCYDRYENHEWVHDTDKENRTVNGQTNNILKIGVKIVLLKFSIHGENSKNPYYSEISLQYDGKNKLYDSEFNRSQLSKCVTMLVGSQQPL